MAEVEQDTQKAWQRLIAECPFQATEDGTCTNENNLTPECTVWACPATLAELCGQAIDEECARCEGAQDIAGKCATIAERVSSFDGGKMKMASTMRRDIAATIRERFGVK